MSGPTWTPAPAKGIIPLRPLTFGLILGRSFSALRHNPKVLFGFAVVIQLVATVASAAALIAVAASTFSRLETIPPGSEEFGTVMAGTVGINLLAAFLISLASIAFSAIVQGVVAADVADAVVGEVSTLGRIWRRVRPAIPRLLGFAGLSIAFALAIGLIIGALVFVGLLATGGPSAGAIAMVALLGLLVLLATVPLLIWLGTKLMLTPSILVLERSTFGRALVRSWRLIRGRFWVAFGVLALIVVIMGAAAQLVGLPTGMLSSMLGSVIAPTADTDSTAFVTAIIVVLLPQILVLAIQAVATVVQATAGTLVYVDSRMRYEGLDQALLAYVERRGEGVSADLLPDPFAVDPARAVTSAPPPAQTPEWAAPYPAPGYPTQGYPTQGYPAPEYLAPGYPPQAYPAPGYSAPRDPAQGAPPPVPPIQGTPPPPSDSPWAPPGSST